MDIKTSQKASAIRNLQPRAPAAIYNDDSDDDESGEGSLSSDYKAQHKTTLDLIDFFKNAPPPPVPTLPPVVVDEKKKRSLLQRLKARKTSGSSVGRDSNRNGGAAVPPRKTSPISISNKFGEATLPNGKKYIMLAVDPKDKDSGALAADSTAKRLSMGVLGEDSRPKRESRLNNSNFLVTTTIQGDPNTNGINDSHKRGSVGSDKRRSIIIQAGGGEGSSFSLDSTPFLLDNFALDTEFIMPSTETNPSRQQSNVLSPTTAGHTSNVLTDNVSKQGAKINPMGEEAVSKALASRIANHKAQIANGMQIESAIEGCIAAELLKAPEVVLPRPVPRKKVRHVQIQTQYCVTRPMYSQTEPIGPLVENSEMKELGTQTSSVIPAGTAEMGTSTETEPTPSSTTKTAGTKTSKETSTSTTDTSTDTQTYPSNSPPPLTAKEREEFVRLRQQNVALRVRVASLQRDLAAETRARTRTAVAMQDTREKFEMLSAVAYKKLKEMIFQRHILEMEVRELRAQVDMQAEEKEMFNQQQQHQYQDEFMISVGLE
ncbi:hypothetical protein BGZ65_012837 [Modicella reniformis]|uniref:Uncharacterized protein n=1 Tax=Modicella reniformis TaxID=1440133 RepID=A0A9P6IP29_9FUNG|nr:hypothetical protein BGZ65_012837 [Modicella reniformis]